MSRTDKTKPFWVKMMHEDVAWVEEHDHTDGVCDMPPIRDGAAYVYGTTQCRRQFVYTGVGTCGCWRCRSYDWPLSNRGYRRKARRLAKRDVWEWHREYE